MITRRYALQDAYGGGKSDEYYVVVPVAYYQSLKEELSGGGIRKIRTITISATVLSRWQMIIMRTHMGTESYVHIMD